MPSRQPLSSSNPNQKTTIVFISVTSSASVIILFAILYFAYYLWYSLIRHSRTSPFDSTAPFVKIQRFTYKELKVATNGFNETNSIGKGGSGMVFKGVLKDGKLVAVKILIENSLQGEREFQNELQILGGLSSPFIVNLLGYCIEKSKKIVVYEYMVNHSLQESLFSETDTSLNWSRRFDIILDVSKALAFLHLECDPPVIHGDVKPSNVLLGVDYKAKLSDFGLSRFKLEGEFGVDLFSQDLGKSQELWKSQELSGNLVPGSETETPGIRTPVENHLHGEVDFALALQTAASSSKNSKFSYNNNLRNVVKEDDSMIKEVSQFGEIWNKCSNYEDDNLNSCERNCKVDLKLNAAFVDDPKPLGKDWWWRQDERDELCTKDYVMEWIGSQIHSNNNEDWENDGEKKCSPHKSDDVFIMKQQDKVDHDTYEAGFEPIRNNGVAMEDEEESRKKKHRKMQEWWKEEHLHELTRKTKNPTKKSGIHPKNCLKVPHFGLGKQLYYSYKRKKTKKKNNNNNAGGDGGEKSKFSFKRGSINSEMWSGDVLSRELSSTTSMRGTLCYVAPEYGGCGLLMEKADIYSLGVLILVIISGRRPLHVLSSPMKLEKANLVSWCKHLAQKGNILELIDEKLIKNGDYDKEQASLCINLALACLQRSPELRPEIGDIVKILKEEMEVPSLPFEFSPSPPCKLGNRSRRIHKMNGD